MIGRLIAILGPSQRHRVKSAVAWMIVAAVLQGIAVSLLVPVLRAMLDGDTTTAWRWLGLLGGATVLALAAHYVQAVRGFRLALAVLTTLHERLGAHLVRLPLGWFDATSAGRLAQISNHAVMSVSQSVAHYIAPIVSGIVTPAVIVVFLLAYTPALGLIALASAPLLFVSFRLAARLLGRADTAVDAAAVAAGSRVLEFARAQQVLRAFGRSAGRYVPLDAAIGEQQSTGRRMLWVTVPGMLLTGLLLQVTFTLTLGAGTALVVDGRLDAVTLAAVMALLARFLGPLAVVSELSGGLRMARNDLDRLSAVLDTAVLDEPDVSASADSPGVVELDAVTFGYAESSGTGTPVLNNVSLRAEPGSLTAIVGPSGSGKTTTLRLIARFWDADDGHVRVGGADVRELTYRDLSSSLSMVFQDVYLFDDTLRANVLLGNPDATAAELDHAAGLSGLDEVITRLPAGWDTRVGEAGARLSGGEAQRVSIARALLKSAPVVLLDEATAALDPANEHLIRRAIIELKRTSTVIVVAHTPALIDAADQVIVLNGGSVVEHGSPAELRTAGGLFARLWGDRVRAAGWRLGSTS